ncbi:hypothetical protein ASPZODRAFT_20632 [Penicilliopsis zonata CBS 506.65]|uniref:Uncharacterized protein n=1 Tax=Penicilliopsis zonata CBS 506.65 TaxID=1073090 RepID=A0A1L9S555_9EURO|nr:hypothetical protein ASPZODRAFT_20632 [Penicilliopsis zonata CBS 506.65]OJJ42309.1 hypothetical protein ASPZODRAFT_20632 [Penicilliopsis zonata CBS 506.65]
MDSPLIPSSLGLELGGDLIAAVVAATAVAPTVTILDRVLVEKATLGIAPRAGFQSHLRAALGSPARFLLSRPHRLVWTLYATTYAVANTTEDLAAASDLPLSTAASATFLCTLLVNVPLGVRKDLRFAQLFGRGIPPPAGGTGATASLALLLLRDAITIFGSFTLAPWCMHRVPDSLGATGTTVVLQLMVPMASQLVATPVHLLGLDFYHRRDRVPWGDRLVTVGRHLGPATALRCMRILPAFGFGCLANTALREYFHSAFHSPAKEGIL